MSSVTAQRDDTWAALRCPQVGRRMRVPLWAVALVLAWLGVIGAGQYFKPANAPSICHFKTITGLPCPTCGTTRALLAMGRGDVVHGWLYNPFVVTALILAALWLVFRLTTGRTIQLQCATTVRRMLWTGIALLFVANWVYLIRAGI